jgi:altronate hydrolase
MSAPAAIRIHPADDIVIACRQLLPGTVLPRKASPWPAWCRRSQGGRARHRSGRAVRRYNQIIGFARQAIAPGQHVHTHNLAMGDFARDYAAGSDVHERRRQRAATFDGIVRADGRVATRNYIGILTSVNCSATVARNRSLRRDIHPEALAVSQHRWRGGAHARRGLRPATAMAKTCACCAARWPAMRAMPISPPCWWWASAARPTRSTRCSTNRAWPRWLPSTRFHSFNIQVTGGTAKTVARGIGIVQALLDDANRVTRQPVSASHLVVGLQCGGSDGYSGITANPALGAAVDLLVAQGGTAILSETPEIYGAEHLLTRRAVSPTWPRA